ncbi:collagen alpha-1(II) chain-like [Hippopotamus amphibius kiboko]|uniref:collagen alpha-1(II) chain-like n=1 Tax=Hippopotamus amphibius kiboko TaxID=575201 RepID=UPI00259562CA|nr:collagen alpha-1(II) chain-like [Hippopotamus amphibius kiboko]
MRGSGAVTQDDLCLELLPSGSLSATASFRSATLPLAGSALHHGPRAQGRHLPPLGQGHHPRRSYQETTCSPGLGPPHGLPSILRPANKFPFTLALKSSLFPATKPPNWAQAAAPRPGGSGPGARELQGLREGHRGLRGRTWAPLAGVPAAHVTAPSPRGAAAVLVRQALARQHQGQGWLRSPDAERGCSEGGFQLLVSNVSLGLNENSASTNHGGAAPGGLRAARGVGQRALQRPRGCRLPGGMLGPGARTPARPPEALRSPRLRRQSPGARPRRPGQRPLVCGRLRSMRLSRKDTENTPWALRGFGADPPPPWRPAHLPRAWPRPGGSRSETGPPPGRGASPHRGSFAVDATCLSRAAGVWGRGLPGPGPRPPRPPPTPCCDPGPGGSAASPSGVSASFRAAVLRGHGDGLAPDSGKKGHARAGRPAPQERRRQRCGRGGARPRGHGLNLPDLEVSSVSLTHVRGKREKRHRDGAGTPSRCPRVSSRGGRSAPGSAFGVCPQEGDLLGGGCTWVPAGTAAWAPGQRTGGAGGRTPEAGGPGSVRAAGPGRLPATGPHAELQGSGDAERQPKAVPEPEPGGGRGPGRAGARARGGAGGALCPRSRGRVGAAPGRRGAGTCALPREAPAPAVGAAGPLRDAGPGEGAAVGGVGNRSFQSEPGVSTRPGARVSPEAKATGWGSGALGRGLRSRPPQGTASRRPRSACVTHAAPRGRRGAGDRAWGWGLGPSARSSRGCPRPLWRPGGGAEPPLCVPLHPVTPRLVGPVASQAYKVGWPPPCSPLPPAPSRVSGRAHPEFTSHARASVHHWPDRRDPSHPRSLFFPQSQDTVSVPRASQALNKSGFRE